MTTKSDNIRFRAAGRVEWSPPVLALLLFAVGTAGWAAMPTFRHVIEVGMEQEEQSHVLLVPLIGIWLFWLRRARMDLVPPRPSWSGVAVVAVGWALGRWGFHSGVQAAEHLGAYLVVLGVVLAFTGLKLLRHFAALLPLVVFAIPVPGVIREAIAQPLQQMAALVTHETLILIGVDSIRQGNVLVVNGFQVAVAEACNGMRLVFALGLVVYAFVFCLPIRTTPRIILLATAPAVALVCNVVRLVPTAVFYGFGTEEAAQTFHDLSGWAMLFVALAIVWQQVRLLEWLEVPVQRMRYSAS